MLFEHQSYRSYLKEVLVSRIQKNENYSLRAFAAQISIAPGMLSEVFKGAKNISQEKGHAIAARLGLSSTEEDYFLTLIRLETASEIGQRERLVEKLNSIAPRTNYRDLSIDHYQTIANWICAAGYALLDLAPEGMTANEIGVRLGTTAFEAEEAMARWVRLGAVERDGDGRYSKMTDETLMMRSSAPAEAIRTYHRTMLEKAGLAFAEQTNDEKYVGSETLAFDPESLPAIGRILEEAAAKILAEARKGANRTEVYHFGFQMFRLTKKRKKK